MTDINCIEITTDYELVVVQCLRCGFHLGVDAGYLEQVGCLDVTCPSCQIAIHIAD